MFRRIHRLLAGSRLPSEFDPTEDMALFPIGPGVIDPEVQARVRELRRRALGGEQRTIELRMCRRCGATSCAVNRDRLPSTRLGMHSQCRDGGLFYEHRWIRLTQREYDRLIMLPANERLTVHRFHRED